MSNPRHDDSMMRKSTACKDRRRATTPRRQKGALAARMSLRGELVNRLRAKS